MSFFFNWLSLASVDIKSSINTALSATTIPQFPQSIAIKSLSLGDSPPTFELMDIVDLKDGKFRGLFKFNYSGELNVTLCSDLEINSLRLIQFDAFTKPHFVLSDKSTILPVDFKIDELKIDGLLTVVYNGKNITVVFKDDPMIDLKIETSIDDLLDDDLFDMIKQDTLKMAIEFLKQDLPAMIHKLKILDDYIDMDDVVEHEDVTTPGSELNRSSSSLSIDANYHYPSLNMNIYDTMSLKPTGFTDVVQRISLSQAEYQTSSLDKHKSEVASRKKRRVIKMKKIMKKTNQTTPCSSPLIMSQEIQATPTSNSVNLKETSYTSSPTLFEETTFNSMDEFLNQDTLILSDHDLDQHHDSFTTDPYESLIHPMDILPSFSDSEAESALTPNTQKLSRPRGPSSNYMNLNEFKKLSLYNFKERSEQPLVD